MQERKGLALKETENRRCQLCNTDCCDIHKSSNTDGVCEMNHHITYCINAAHKRRHALVEIFTSMEEREAWIGEHGMENVPGGGGEESV